MAYIILNRDNFFNNLDIISKQTKSKDKIAIVLKDNAYGHGLFEMAEMSKEYGIKKAVVRSCDDAKKIEDFFDYILVLGEIPSSASKKVRYTINSLESIGNFPKRTLVELKVDSGMHRNGVLESELREAFVRIKKAGLILEGVFTHHRAADELTSEWFWQNENFKRVKEEAKALADEFGLSELRFHSANSASLFRCENFDEDMARVGIASYGCLEGNDELKPVLSLYAKKISTRELKKSQRVGYGGKFIAEKDSIVSNYDFGYGDGFLRCASNRYIAPNGERQVGTISMDNSSFIAQAGEILIFKDARVVAKQADTISYEVLTSLKSYIKREIV
ncbi:hypothetical protein M947_06355 [Sulfurimonas hongkongensis]|uniref:Alanine racemase C-terminal domain-containing protein n=1 Tax=Sulfurimonas hongkongensis TaxID=1172190 RepID=T0JNA3_9BACT|nr:alanine racemase [Sulfurimonas hongkongensis]EQB39611.1 hypothetical protein M947_06355 [Sulfurimonas hongkongensis]